MPNPFDQFDAAPAAKNAFDQFDDAQETNDTLKQTAKNFAGGPDAALSIVAGIPAYIASGLSGLGRLMMTGDINKANDTLRKVQEDNFGLGAPKPFTKSGQQASEMLSEGQGYLRDKAGDLAGDNEALRSINEGAVDLTMNMLPVPGGKLVRSLGKGLEREFGRKPDATPQTPPAPVAPKPVNPFDQFDPRAQQELPLNWNEQHIAESKQADINPAQRDLFGDQNIPSVDLGGTPMEKDVQLKRTQQYMDERNQGLIDDSDHGYVANQYGGGQGGLRIDENGVPIRADRSMEAQNLQDPLQRNLWGDELPRQSVQEAVRGITAAIDRMPAGEARTSGINMLNGKQRGAINLDEIAKGFKYLKDGFISPTDYVKTFYGAFHKADIDVVLENLRDPKDRSTIMLMSPDQFLKVAEKRPAEYMAGPIPEIKRSDIREGLKSDKGLRQIPFLWVKDAPGSVVGGMKVTGHEGRHRMDVFKEMGIEKVPVIVKHETRRWGSEPKEQMRMIAQDRGSNQAIKSPGSLSRYGSQRGAVDPAVFKEGFKGLNRFLSKLTEQPWIKERFGYGFEKNADGTPKVLLHGTTRAFDDNVKVKAEGVHAGYAGPANMKAGSAKLGKAQYRIGAMDFQRGDNAIYPVVIRKGNYPKLSTDHGYWSPVGLSKSTSFISDVANSAGIPIHDVIDAMDNFHENVSKSLVARTTPEINQMFTDMLKNELGINGFWYENPYESPKSKLGISHRYSEDSLQRKHVLQTNMSDPQSFVTWSDNNIRSVYDNGQTPMRVPAGQRGAIDLGPSKTPSPLPDVTSMDREHPLVIAAKAELDKRVGINTVNKVLDIPYVDNITTPEQVLASGGKDIGPVAAARMKTVGSGVNSAALSSNNPLIKFARYVVRTAEKAADKLSETYLTNPQTGLVPKWNKLSDGEKNGVMATLMEQDRNQTWLTPEELSSRGLSDKQQAVVNHVREMEQVKLQEWNKALELSGMDKVPERPGHFPGNFTGDYRTLVMNEKGHVVGYVGTATKWGHNKVLDQLKADMPDHKFVSLGRKNLAGLGEAQYQTAMSELAKVLIENDPEFKALSQKVNTLVANNADKLYAAHLHAMDKKGIWGTEGNKPWLDATENTKEAMTAYIHYWDTGMHSHLNLPVETQLKGLINNPSLDMPNAKSYLEKYVQHMSGRSVSNIAMALDTLLDSPARLVGAGPSLVRSAINQTTKRTGQLLMAFGNLGHTAVQMLQVPSMSVPQFMNIAHQFNINPLSIGQAHAQGISMLGSFLREAITGDKKLTDPYSRATLDFAHDMGYNHFSEFQDIQKTSQSKTGRVIDDAIDLNRQIPEITTRPFTFFTIMDMLREVPSLTMQEKLHAAYNATQEAMVDYTPREKPMIYADLGQLGKLTGSLSTFKHAAFSQAGRLAKEVGRGNVAPAATLAGVMFALAGVRGIFGYDDADAITKFVTEKGGNRRSIRELVLDPNVSSEVIKSGALSAYTGLDLAGRVNVNGFIPEGPAQAVAGPFGTKIGKIAAAGYQAGKQAAGQGNGPIDYKNLVLEMMPGGWVHNQVQEKLMNDPETNRLAGKDALPGNDRTPFDVAAHRAGFTSLKQARLSESLYNDAQRQHNDTEAQKDVISRAQKYFAQGILVDKDGNFTSQGKDLFTEYMKRGGDPDLWASKIEAEGINLKQSKLQRSQGIPEGDLGSVHRYKSFDRSREYANKP